MKRVIGLSASWVIWAFALLTAPSPVSAQAPGVVVRKAPVTVARQTFDPKHLPPKMPPLVPGEAGLCHYEFTTDIALSCDVEQIASGEVNIFPDSAEINLSMPVTIFLLPKAPKRIIEHEEGHRSICEYYYANIDVYAKRAAQARMGKSFNGKGKDKQAAIDDAMNKAIGEIREEILANTRVRAVAANERYDAITDHSRNPGSQADAAAKAMSEDPEPKGGKPTNLPATTRLTDK